MPPGARRVAGGVCRPSGNKPEGVQPPEKRMRPGESADAGFRTEGKILEARTAGELLPPAAGRSLGLEPGLQDRPVTQTGPPRRLHTSVCGETLGWVTPHIQWDSDFEFIEIKFASDCAVWIPQHMLQSSTVILLGAQGGPWPWPWQWLMRGNWQGQTQARWGSASGFPTEPPGPPWALLVFVCSLLPRHWARRGEAVPRGGTQGQHSPASLARAAEAFTVRRAKCPASSLPRLLLPTTVPTPQTLRRVLCFQNFKPVPTRSRTTQDPGYEVPEGVWCVERAPPAGGCTGGHSEHQGWSG